MGEKVDVFAIALKVAPFLPGYKAPVQESGSWGVTLPGADGRGLFIHCNEWGNSRLRISGIYPRFENQVVTGWLYPSAHAPEITISPLREPQAIARDIARRILPAYEELFDRCRVKVAELEEAKRQKADATAALCEVLGCTPSEAPRTCSASLAPGLWAEFSADSQGSVDLRLRYAPLPLALAICRQLMALTASDRVLSE